ncbi:DUF2169 family type VI secretion system accessory protein [Roseibium sp. M-1]
MPAIIKPTRVSVAYQTEPSRDGALTTVSAYALFDFADPGRLLTEQALWPMVTEQMPNGAIFDKGQLKPKGEVIIAGCALSPTDAPIEGITVTARFGAFQKQLAVFGDRYWQLTDRGLQISRPAPFLKMPIGDVQAFGGAGYAPNPRGKGFSARNLVDAGYDAPLPNVENPAQLIKSLDDRPVPVHFGPIQADDPARLRYLGTYDQYWMENVSPLKPEDFNPLYHCEAPAEQRFDKFFSGGETFMITGMSRGEASVGGALPRLTARCFYKDIPGDALMETSMRCDTVTLFPNVQKAVLTFRGLVRGTDRFAEDIGAIMVALEHTDAPRRDGSFYADVFQKRTSKEEGHKYALADYQLMPEVDPAVLSAKRQAKLEKAAADRQKFSDNQTWALRKMLEDEGLPGDLVQPQPNDILDDIPLVAQPTAEELENGEVDLAALLDDIQAVEDALLEKRDREMVKAELRRRAVVASLPPDRLPPKMAVPIVEDDLVARFPDIGIEPEFAESLAQIGSQSLSSPDRLSGNFSGASEGDDRQLAALTGLDDLFGTPSEEEAAETAYQKAVARAQRLPEGSLLADMRKAIRDMDLSGLDHAGPEADPGAAPTEVLPTAVPLDEDAKNAVTERLQQGLTRPGASKSSQQDFDNLLDALLESGKATEARHLKPTADQSPAEGAPSSIATALEQLDKSESMIDENMAMARQQAPAPIFPLEELPEGVAIRLGAFVAGKLREGYDFKGADLAGADLRGLDFSGRDLADTFFERADLTGARFAGCNLTGAVFTGATLDNADLSGTDLTHANLSRVKARNLRLDNAKLNDIHIFQSDFAGATGNNADLEKVRFLETILDGFKLHQSRITDCQFLSGSADGFEASASRLLRSAFVLMSMKGMDISDSDLERVAFVETQAPGMNGRNGKWLSVGVMGACDLTGSRFAGLNAMESSFNTAKMAECCFLRAQGNACFFNACDLESNDFRLASFRNSLFGRSNFKGSDFFGANLFMAALTGVDLRQCSMRAANLYAADLLEAKLTGCDLTGANLGLTLLEQPANV